MLIDVIADENEIQAFDLFSLLTFEMNEFRMLRREESNESTLIDRVPTEFRY